MVPSLPLKGDEDSKLTTTEVMFLVVPLAGCGHHPNHTQIIRNRRRVVRADQRFDECGQAVRLEQLMIKTPLTV